MKAISLITCSRGALIWLYILVSTLAHESLMKLLKHESSFVLTCGYLMSSSYTYMKYVIGDFQYKRKRSLYSWNKTWTLYTSGFF